MDKAFCESIGFEVVDTPGAFGMIDEHTLLYGIHLYMPVWAEALKGGLPGCYIGTPVELLERYVHLQEHYDSGTAIPD